MSRNGHEVGKTRNSLKTLMRPPARAHPPPPCTRACALAGIYITEFAESTEQNPLRVSAIDQKLKSIKNLHTPRAPNRLSVLALALMTDSSIAEWSIMAQKWS